MAFGNAFSDDERCVLAGYANGDVRSGIHTLAVPSGICMSLHIIKQWSCAALERLAMIMRASGCQCPAQPHLLV